MNRLQAAKGGSDNSIMPPESTPQRPTLLVERELLSVRLADRLQLAIIRGELLPGERLTEKAIASEAQVSRSTVREALRLLSQSGLVELVPMSGARVMTLTLKDVREIGGARIALETHAAREIAAATDTPDLVDAQERVERLSAATREHQLVDIIDADVRFHRSIVAATRNGRLLQFWQNLEPQLRLFLSYHAEEAYDLVGLVDAHRALLEILRTGNADRAADAFKSHIAERTNRRESFWKEVTSSQ